MQTIRPYTPNLLLVFGHGAAVPAATATRRIAGAAQSRTTRHHQVQHRYPQHQHHRPRQGGACYSTQAQTQSQNTRTSTPTPQFTARTLSSHSARIGKCATFGLRAPEQIAEAASLCTILATEWRDLLAGGEGFLTDRNRRGLWRQQVVWGEQDVMGHVNNVIYNKWAESARVNWAGNYARIDPEHARQWNELCSARSNGLIMKAIKTDFKFPIQYPDRVTVLHKIASIPEPESEAFELDVLILSERHRRPAARCVEELVLYNYRQAAKVKLRELPFLLSAFRDTFELQEQMRERMAARAAEIESRITALEKGSWDRPDAVEDFGSASSSPSSSVAA